MPGSLGIDPVYRAIYRVPSKCHKCTLLQNYLLWFPYYEHVHLSLLLFYALFLTDDPRDEDFVPADDFAFQPRSSRSRRGKAVVTEPRSSRGRIKSAAKRKKLADHSSDDEIEEEIAPDEVPAQNMKTCSLKMWTQLRKTNPYRFAERPFHGDPRFWTRS